MPDPVYFDSSVFLSIFMGESSGPSIKQLLKELTRDKTKIYTSIITIQEVSVHPSAREHVRPTTTAKLANSPGFMA
jgi:predicted nucleic acid-binding protein